MKIAFSTISCPDYTVSQMAHAVRAFDYDGIELYALEGQRLLPDLLAERLQEFQQQLKNVPIVAINSWGQLSSSDNQERQAQEHQIARTFELAADLACSLVKTFGGALPVGRSTDEVFNYMADSIQRLAERGQTLGVTLVLETHDGFCLGSTLGELLRRVEHPNFAALWDVHHPYRMGEPVAETDKLIGQRVRHVHIKDAVREGEHWRFVRLGQGELPVRAMIERLHARGYQGTISVDWEKMWHPHLDDPEVALPQYAAVLRTYLNALSG